MRKIIIPFVIISIFAFTGVAIWLQYTTSIELSSTLITCFFGFCGGELWVLGSIKKAKIKKETDIEMMSIKANANMNVMDEPKEEDTKKYVDFFK